ncbi:MAG: hypothetical protein KAI47_23200 [Deltaproteobacteria bacterium]|nr:hypothetical protein [Deltaproteobacteria bacterium]
MTGSFEKTADLGGGSATSKGGRDLFVSSFDLTGAHRFQRALGGVGDDESDGVAASPTGAIYLTGYFQGTVDLGGGNIVAQGNNQDVFLLKLGP